jgi:hypothetical protein
MTLTNRVTSRDPKEAGTYLQSFALSILMRSTTATHVIWMRLGIGHHFRPLDFGSSSLRTLSLAFVRILRGWVKHAGAPSLTECHSLAQG